MKTYTIFDVLDMLSKIEREYHAQIPDIESDDYYVKLLEWETVLDIKSKFVDELK